MDTFAGSPPKGAQRPVLNSIAGFFRLVNICRAFARPSAPCARHSHGLCFRTVDFFRAGGSRQRRGARKAGRSFSRTPPRRSGAETTRGTGQQERRTRPPPRAFAADCAARSKRGGGRALRRRRPKRRRHSQAPPRRGTHRERREAAQRRGTDALASARRAAVRTANGGKRHNGAERTHLQARAPVRARPPIQAAGGAAAPRAGVSRAAISKRGWAGRTSN